MKPEVGHAAWTHLQRGVAGERTLLSGGAIFVGTAGVLLSAYGLLPREAALPVIATSCFVLAALAALAATLRPQATANRITLWDIAGALTFIGIFASALIAPEQLVQIIEGTGERN